MKVTRPILRYHGGKFLLAKWIISHFPAHRIYVEPYGGAGSVLLQKERAYAEIYNEKDDEIVNLFNVVRNDGEALIDALRLTPFARKEFELSYQKTDDSLEQARRTIVRSFMGFGSGAASQQKTGFRSNSNRSGTTPAHDWANLPEAYFAIIERLRGVVIENKDALEIMSRFDNSKTLIYADPPYVHSTRSKGKNSNAYRFEMDDTQQEQLCIHLQSLQSMIILSAYENTIYDGILKDWRKVYKMTYAGGTKLRKEVLYISPNISVK